MGTDGDDEAGWRRVAFGDARHDGGLRRPPGDQASGLCRWLAAAVLGASGRYATATNLLRPLVHGRDPLLASLAASALASHRRQLGGHGAALPLDGMAANLATVASGEPDRDGLDPEGAWVDALLGLAADNLATGRLAAARRLLERAAETPAGWRARARTGWVRAEVALAAGNPAEAVPAARDAARVSREQGARRHSIKSDLVLAASLAATGEETYRHQATGLVAEALASARRDGLRSLVWPAGLLAADLLPAEAAEHRESVTRELHSLLQAADAEDRRLARESAWVPL